MRHPNACLQRHRIFSSTVFPGTSSISWEGSVPICKIYKPLKSRHIEHKDGWEWKRWPLKASHGKRSSPCISPENLRVFCSSHHCIQTFHRLLGQLELAVIDAATKEVVENHLQSKQRVHAVFAPVAPGHHILPHQAWDQHPSWPEASSVLLQAWKGCFPSSCVKNLGMWSSARKILFSNTQLIKLRKTKGPANITIRLDQDGKGDHIWLHRSLLKNVWETLRPPGSPWHPYLFCHPSERGLLPHLLIDLHSLINLTCSGEAFDQSCIKHLGK